MNPLQLMDLRKDGFTQNDMLIYETIRQNPSRIIHMTTSTLAEQCGVSQPALSRFVKGLGYNRYQDFRADLIAWLAMKNEQSGGDLDHQSYFADLYELLKAAEGMLTEEYMQGLVKYILGFRRIFASGIGKSYHPAQLFETLMWKSRRSVRAVGRDALVELTDYMEEGDLLIVFSVSGGAHIMQDVCRTSADIMLVTANAGHAYKDQVQKTVALPYTPPDPEAGSVSPVLFDIFVELLVSYCLQEKIEPKR